MSPQTGMLEILLLAGLALAVLGPKDLALGLRKLGRWIGQIRLAAYEFQQRMDVFGQDLEAEKDTPPKAENPSDPAAKP